MRLVGRQTASPTKKKKKIVNSSVLWMERISLKPLFYFYFYLFFFLCKNFKGEKKKKKKELKAHHCHKKIPVFETVFRKKATLNDPTGIFEVEKKNKGG